jgi:hypothetical protein
MAAKFDDAKGVKPFEGGAAALQVFIGKMDAIFRAALAEESEDEAGTAEARVASTAVLKLQGTAELWRQTLTTEAEKKCLLTWSALKKALVARFGSELTLAERFNLSTKLKQGDNESPRDLYDRVVLAVQELERDVRDDMRETEAWQAARTERISERFLAALHEDIAQEVTADVSVNSLEELRAKASAVWRAKKKGKPSTTRLVAATTTTETIPGAPNDRYSKLERELAELKGAMKQWGFKKNQQGEGKTGDGANGEGTKKKKRKCYACGKWGFHFASSCPERKVNEVSAEDRAAPAPSDNPYAALSPYEQPPLN